MSRQLYEIKYDITDPDKFNTELSTYKNITFIGIQGKPGLQFIINESETITIGKITIGNTGILQIDLTNGDIPPIFSISFDAGQDKGNLPLLVHLIAEENNSTGGVV